MVTRLFTLAVLAMALLASPLRADDTEIYTGYNLEREVKPNVVFIIDTSGSMGPMSGTLTYNTFDPAITYSGDCTADKVYWGVAGVIPSCTTNNWFYQANNVCQALIPDVGMLTDQVAMWTGAKWDTTLSTVNHNRMIECQDDHASWWGNSADGLTKDDGKYAAKSGQWTTSSKSKLSYGGTYQLYTANYLNYLNSGEGSLPKELTRLETVQEVLKNLIDSVNGINLAIMRFDGGGAGGYFVTPMLELNDTNRPTFKAAIKALAPGGDTPLAESLYEATLYFRGEPAYFGKGKNVAGIMDAAGKYITPIEYQCQRNFVVLFSDGDPNGDNAADTLIKNQPGFSALAPACYYKSGSSDCLPSQAQYLFRKDLHSFNDTQNVVTYTIGFEEGMSTFGLNLMKAAATNGNGFYRGTSNAKDITEAFNSIITNILSVNTSFTAPAVSVNAFNRLTYLDHLYFGLFKTGDDVRWDGNIKRYRLGKPASGSGLAILDASGNDAIDSNTGFFKSTARSWWSADQDGDEVAKGGAASNMPLSRKAYTCCYGGSSDLSSGANKLSEDNANITAAELGAASAVERTELLQWARGVDVYNSDGDEFSTDARSQMGDPLHTEPVLVTYGDLGGGKPDLTLFTTTNEGILHAIDTATGKEIFSYLPRELLPKVKTIATNALSGARVYGLDGPISVWFHDEDFDGTIEPATDHVYLYVTMRRGGNYIYALDVTDRDNPKQLWKIQGGAGDFAELSQTWSKPTLAKVKFTGEEKQVLFFGGGYDVAEDDYTVTHKQAESDKIGRAIFMVDAETGALLWSAGAHTTATLKLPDMTNSIPSEIRAIDTSGDGLIDRLYVADMRSQLWRFDIDKANKTPGAFATGGIMAKFSAEGTDAGNRRIYYPPSVSLSLRGDYLNIAIGTGYREHPLDTVIQDRFYVVRDRNVFSPPLDEYGNTKYTVATNFLNATAYVTPDTITPEVKALFETSDGFYIDLKELPNSWIGEKVLAPAVTLQGYVIFTTFTPVADEQAEACAPSQGTAREYVMSVEDSTAYDGSSRAVTMTRSGIPPRPVVITTEDGSAVLIGTNFSRGGGLVSGTEPRKAAWRRK